MLLTVPPHKEHILIDYQLKVSTSICFVCQYLESALFDNVPHVRMKSTSELITVCIHTVCTVGTL